MLEVGIRNETDDEEKITRQHGGLSPKQQGSVRELVRYSGILRSVILIFDSNNNCPPFYESKNYITAIAFAVFAWL
jgi:uncharacterized protein (DUF1330 family)